MHNLKFQKIKDEVQKGDRGSIIDLVNYLLSYAKDLCASDLHLSPNLNGLMMRLRVDGVLQDVVCLPSSIHLEIISRIKVLAKLRTDEHYGAQDGRFSILLDDVGLDIRVSVVPTYYGENAVMRLLSERLESVSLDALGFSKEDQEKIVRSIKNPYGMILATGPTGSGKTTTLYTFLKQLNTKDRSIITIEDPIEYSIAGINQIQVNAKTGLTFANGLKSILRQDPDIVMVGEIRDKETAGIAVNTALTGHLVFSTLHTNDAATTLPRLIDLGLEPYLISATVNLVVAQRLVRMICPNCKCRQRVNDSELENFQVISPMINIEKEMFCKGAGCDNCNSLGYSGRLGIYEVMVVDDSIREAMLNKLPSIEIKKLAQKNGMKIMAEDGLRKALAGITTVDEVLRVIHE